MTTDRKLMSFEEVLAQQLRQLNDCLNQLLDEAADDPNTLEVINNFRAEVANISNELENGTLQGVIGHIFLFLLHGQKLFNLVQNTETGLKLAAILKDIRGYYLPNNEQPPDAEPNSTSAAIIEAELLQEELELEQAKNL